MIRLRKLRDGFKKGAFLHRSSQPRELCSLCDGIVRGKGLQSLRMVNTFGSYHDLEQRLFTQDYASFKPIAKSMSTQVEGSSRKGYSHQSYLFIGEGI